MIITENSAVILLAYLKLLQSHLHSSIIRKTDYIDDNLKNYNASIYEIHGVNRRTSTRGC